MKLNSYCAMVGLVVVTASCICFCCTAQSALGAGTAGISRPGILPDGVKKTNDEDAYTCYAVYNDGKSVYIKLFITDSLQKRKVLKNGAEVWIDVKGKKNKITGILFPLAIAGNNYPGGGDRIAAGGPPSFFTNNGNKNMDTSLPTLVEKRHEMELKGFAGDINGKRDIKENLGGISVSLQIDGDTLIYAAAIPFVALPPIQPDDKPVSIGIVERGIEPPGFGNMDGGVGGDGPPRRWRRQSAARPAAG